MNEKKNLKKQIKKYRREIKLSNYAVRGFMRSHDYMPGSYQQLQKTKIWTIAKRGYKRRIRFNYYQIKMLVVLISFILILIISGIITLF
ncbi:hypothetical protein LCGC14_2659670 [marine sediment metagenome]|uniref:Uncharacterized protein n=1 Tax=marine sediment metagenome TaxID=412755 RepID=A0A0F8ZSA5_9ZZZZ